MDKHVGWCWDGGGDKEIVRRDFEEGNERNKERTKNVLSDAKYTFGSIRTGTAIR